MGGRPSNYLGISMIKIETAKNDQENIGRLPCGGE